MPVINRIAEYHDEMKAWRQHLHANPELGYDCHETAAFVVDRLREFGVEEIETGIGQTGVVALIRGKTDGPVVGLRADMDALPIQEVRDLPYKSKHPGKMHACGHDGHTTMLLGAAKYLAEARDFDGTVALIFQPAEEGGGGGLAMCQDGMMERFGIREVYGIHNTPNADFGTFSTRSGPLMAAADTFRITIKGHGAHAAMPHLSVDPILVSCQVAQGLQMIAARNVDPLKSSVISITTINGGSTHNVIPEDAVMTGTVRTLDADVRDMVEARMAEVADGIAKAHGATSTFEYERGYPVTINNAEAVAFSVGVAEGIAGPERVTADAVPMMGSEDFSYMLEERKGAYLFLGTGGGAGLHHPEYDFNDEVSPIGASFFAKIVETALPAAAS
ncbi:MAG: M20 aminoacylase family protein [Pseudomonadota bacterium]